MNREPISSELRQIILERDNFTCRYCGSKVGPFHLDHVYPVSKGGETTMNNLVTSCDRCNMAKHTSVGLWPKPIGYFEHRNSLLRRFTWIYSISVTLATLSLAVSQIFRQEYLVLVALFFSGVILCLCLLEGKILQ